LTAKTTRIQNGCPLEAGVKKTITWAKAVGPKRPKYLKKVELETGDVPKT